MHRRSLLSSAAALAVGLAGCANSTLTAAQITAQTATDAKLIADAFLPLVQTVATMAGATPAVVAAVGTDVAQLEAAASAIQPGIAAAVAQPSVSTIGSALQGILTALTGLTLPANVAAVLSAAQTLLPLLQAAVGIAIAVGEQPLAMTPAGARVVLAGAAKR